MFSYPDYLIWLPLFAVALDLLLGDPACLPHPVRLVGNFLKLLQKYFLEWPTHPQLAGILALLSALGLSACAVWMLTSLPYLFGIFFMAYFSYAGLALGCLIHEGRKAVMAINSGEIEQARLAVSMLVSRDVKGLEQDGLYRTLAETLSENFTDAFVAPLFWLFCGGPVALWIYKTASTADSMWGYKFAPWTMFGRCAARLDDVLAFVPARLSVFFLYVAAKDKQYWPGFAKMAQEARSMESPNAGWSMASSAWLHNAGMGGKAVYNGVEKQKPFLGPQDFAWTAQKIEALLEQLPRAGLCALLCMWLVTLLFTLIC